MEHYVRSEPIPGVGFVERPAGMRGRIRSWIRRLNLCDLMGDRKPSDYSCLSPRHPDGTRGPILSFSSGGGGAGSGGV